MATQDYNNLDNAVVAEGKRKAWKRNFNGVVLNTEAWTVGAVPPGMSYSVASGALTVNMGVNINEELTITSVESFQIPFRVQFQHSMAQRIANNEVYLEVVNEAGTTYAGWMFDGVTATLAKTTHMNGGSSQPASPTGTITVSTTGATPVIRELNAHMEAVDFSDRAVDSAAAATARATKTRTTLDPDERYFIRMRFKNLGVAPATNTINTIESVLVQDTNDLLVEISAARGDNSGYRSLPVTVNGTATVTFSSQSVSLSASATIGTGTTPTRFIGVTNASQSVKASAGRLFGFILANPGAAAVYFNVYNSTAPTVGTTQPTIQVLVPAGSSFDFVNPVGVAFSTGITIAATDVSIPLSAVAPATTVQASVFWI